MCNNMGFLENLLSGDFSGHFSILSLYFILLSPDEIGQPRSFAVFTNFILKPLFYNLISKLPPLDGTTSEDENFADHE